MSDEVNLMAFNKEMLNYIKDGNTKEAAVSVQAFVRTQMASLNPPINLNAYELNDREKWESAGEIGLFKNVVASDPDKVFKPIRMMTQKYVFDVDQIELALDGKVDIRATLSKDFAKDIVNEIKKFEGDGAIYWEFPFTIYLRLEAFLLESFGYMLFMVENKDEVQKAS